MDNEISGIRELLISIVRESKRVTGSSLGTIIRDNFPNAKLRTKYGGLRAFIEQHCSDEIKWVSKQGGDDIYSHVSVSLTEPSLLETQSLSPTVPNAWQAFSNPNNSFELLIDTTTFNIQTKRVGTLLPPQYSLVPKVTREEHRQIAHDFLSEIDPGFVEPFREALKLDDFWPQWLRLFEEYGQKSLRGRWMYKRNKAIENLLFLRLRELGLSEAVIRKTVKAVSRSGEPPKSDDADPVRDIEGSVSLIEPDLETNLRAFAHAAIDMMSEDDLRRLWLPLGSMVNASRANKRKP